jgi:threonine synthase
MKAEYLPAGWFNVATFQEPGWRIEGKKTLGLEMAEPGNPGEAWELPDAIIYPTGGGTGILGMWKAFDELQQLGLTGDKRPRIYCVQSSATTPLVRAFEQGNADTEARDAGHTLAFGINVPGGIGHFKVLDIIRASGGKALAVDEDAILNSLSAVWQQKHWWVCPEGAACIAALQPLLDSGDLKKGEKVVVINTGSAEKYLPEVQHLML